MSRLFCFIPEGAAKFPGNRLLLQMLCKQNSRVSELGALCCSSVTFPCISDLQGKSQQLLPFPTGNPRGFGPGRGWSRAAHGDPGGDPCWSRAGFPAWSPLLEEKAPLLPEKGEEGWTRPPRIWGRCWHLELPGQAEKKKTGVLGNDNPRSGSSRASG